MKTELFYCGGAVLVVDFEQRREGRPRDAAHTHALARRRRRCCREPAWGLQQGHCTILPHRRWLQSAALATPINQCSASTKDQPLSIYQNVLSSSHARCISCCPPPPPPLRHTLLPATLAAARLNLLFPPRFQFFSLSRPAQEARRCHQGKSPAPNSKPTVLPQLCSHNCAPTKAWSKTRNL